MIVAILLLTLVHEGKPHFGKPEVEHRDLCSNVLLRKHHCREIFGCTAEGNEQDCKDLV